MGDRNRLYGEIYGKAPPFPTTIDSQILKKNIREGPIIAVHPESVDIPSPVHSLAPGMPMRAGTSALRTNVTYDGLVVDGEVSLQAGATGRKASYSKLKPAVGINPVPIPPVESPNQQQSYYRQNNPQELHPNLPPPLKENYMFQGGSSSGSNKLLIGVGVTIAIIVLYFIMNNSSESVPPVNSSYMRMGSR